MNLKSITRTLFALFFIIAGTNHFLSPEFYLPLIPDYLPMHEFLNYFSGVLEILFGVGLLIQKARWISAMGIIILMILFIPSHVFFSLKGACFEGSICIPVWASWVDDYVYELV